MTRQQQEGGTDTYSRGRTLTAVLGIGTAQMDLGGAEPAEPQAGANDQDRLGRTATEKEYDALKSGWWKLAQPSPGTQLREDFDSLESAELGELFMMWVARSVDGVREGFIKHEQPHTCFTARQIMDLWAIIKKDKEDKVDASSQPGEERSDHDR